MALAREERMSECRNEKHIGRVCNAGIAWNTRRKINRWTSTTRTANYNILREICLGRLSGDEAKGWLAMFEAAGSGIPDGKLQKQLELIPLRLDTEKAEKV